MKPQAPYYIFPLLMLLMLSGTAQAQRGVPVHEILRPDYDPLGIRVGAFLIRHELTLGLEYNDNIFATGAIPKRTG